MVDIISAAELDKLARVDLPMVQDATGYKDILQAIKELTARLDKLEKDVLLNNKTIVLNPGSYEIEHKF